ncbi:hypothetical protein Phum_PHUM424570 [Pediculus humanus corporis]|uniref:RHD domain-containing protein n=1 Tax=Pediculus humanus subsp. corporis TaxID=121224 RepID=E0VSZ4_PEDHC|nr:uncharacterized protein Phum_PHUM424570 [Pediculus humanus corporis]EEB16500.1 hypothetical protein Phum_PHUM424570 [Pediculus humanus corporis]
MSDFVEDYQSNSLQYWDPREKFHDLNSSNILSESEYKANKENYKMYNNNNEACLILTIPPENRFRYRYDTEMSGTHGSLQGIRTGRDKSAPTVQLLNYPHEALIRVTLVTCSDDNEYYPHPHSLFVKEKLYQKKIYENWDNKNLTKTGHYSGPHYIRIGTNRQDFTASTRKITEKIKGTKIWILQISSFD